MDLSTNASNNKNVPITPSSERTWTPYHVEHPVTPLPPTPPAGPRTRSFQPFNVQIPRMMVLHGEPTAMNFPIFAYPHFPPPPPNTPQNVYSSAPVTPIARPIPRMGCIPRNLGMPRVEPEREPKKPPQASAAAVAAEPRSDSPELKMDDIEINLDVIYDANSTEESLEKKVKDMEKAIIQYRSVITVFERETRRLKRALTRKEADHQREIKLVSDYHWQKRGEVNISLRAAENKKAQLQNSLTAMESKRKELLALMKHADEILESMGAIINT